MNHARAPRRLSRLRLLAASLSAALTGALLVGPAGPSAAQAASVTVLVQTEPGTLGEVERAVDRLGGDVEVALPIIDGFSASLPADRVDDLETVSGVEAVTPNRAVTLAGQYGEGSGGASAVYTDATRASKAWQQGFSGQGIGVAVIDTGINAVGDLAGRVVGGIDLSGEANHVDGFGHGTFVAGLIAGSGAASGGAVKGMAPDSRLISVKIAGIDGSTDLVRLIAALDFVATTRNVFNTRVVNLSLAVDPLGPYHRDPIDIAVERVWHSGVVVVTAAGNRGNVAGAITAPGDDPFVITAGAADDRTTPNMFDDRLATFSSVGPTADGFVKPDFVASGKSVVSLRTPGSTIDQASAGARIGSHYFKGSGTSFSSAITSGAAALVLSRTPTLTPNQVKARLVTTARSAGSLLPAAGRGSGGLDAFAATVSDDTSSANAGLTPGSLFGASGSDPIPAGSQWAGSQWAGSQWAGSQWAGSQWAGSQWAGSQWAGSQWAGSQWAGLLWAGSQWAGSQWAGSQWAGPLWAGSQWAGSQWAGSQWAGSQWAGSQWAGSQWAGSQWAGSQWATSSWGDS